MAKLYICGEALIDFVPTRAEDGSMAFSPKTGGSPYNAARAAALAGADVSFIGAFSTDMFGETLIADLSASGVDCSKAPLSDDPTTLAFLDTSQGSARYAFFTNGTATKNMSPSADMITPEPYDILSVGSVALIENPAANNIANFCLAQSEKLRIALDPNARPSMTKDKAEWIARMTRISEVATIIKISDEDLDYMFTGMTAEDYAAKTLGGKTELVIVTLGEGGAQAFTKTARATAKPPQITVADTVGAGDALMGATLSWLLEHCADPSTPISGLTQAQLVDMLRFGTTGAALNCTRIGAAPSTKSEILAAIAAGTLP